MLVKHVKVPTVKDSEDASSFSNNIGTKRSQLKPIIIKQESEFNIMNN